MLDYEKIEKALLEIFSEILSMTPGTNLFRGQIPEGTSDVCAVIVDAENTGNDPEIPKFTAQALGKFTERKYAVLRYSQIYQSLPTFGIVRNVDGRRVVIEALLRRGAGGVYPDSDNGIKIWCFSINFIAAVKSTKIAGA